MGRRKTQRKRNCLCCRKEFSYHVHREAEAKFCSRECYVSHRTRPAIERARYAINETGCWVWTGYVSPDGYGRIGKANGSKVAHRVIYEEMVGTIPAGFILDHICRNRKCINPKHLRPVTVGQNNHLGKVMRAVFAWRGTPDPSAVA